VDQTIRGDPTVYDDLRWLLIISRKEMRDVREKREKGKESKRKKGFQKML
jgi:hypothetical protein